MDSQLHTLNEQYGIPGQVSFHNGAGDLITAVINNSFGTASLTLAGAQVMSYRPLAGREVLWASPSAAHSLQGAMRGGIPVCWPWFAARPAEVQEGPFHGLVRTQLFEVCAGSALPGGETELRLRASDTPATRAIWPHAFELEVSVRLGRRLQVAWTARNPGAQAYAYTGALHTYFAVSDVHALTLHGLEETQYLDKYADFERKRQPGPVRIPDRIDNIYLATAGEVTLEDPGFRRTVRVHKGGSHTTVVWNPGDDDVHFPDVGEGQHRHFVCIEAANAVDDVVTVAPGGEAGLSMEIEVEPWGPG